MTDLFEIFIKEKTFLKGVTPYTIRHYRDCKCAFERYKGELTPQGVKNFVMNMVESGMKIGSVNSFSRGMNSYFTWLKENGHTETHLKAPLLKEEKRVLKTYKPEDMKKVISYRPQIFGEKRVMTLLFVLVDTGIRINEAFNLRRTKVDLENLLITVMGKGKKERIIPISRECRKVLYKWLKEHDHELVFCSRNGDKFNYDNARRDFLNILDKVNVEKSEGAFHAFRRYFGKMYTKSGGNLFYLQKMFGHASLEQTKKYVEVEIEDLQAVHTRASPLESLRS